MASTATVAAQPSELLAAARRGDEHAYRRLVEPHRRDLHAHCYRMLGSLHDAEDALQDALLRAWRGLGGFDGRSSIRSWLYRIATNASLDVIERRPKRTLPMDLVAASDGAASPGGPLADRRGSSPIRTPSSACKTDSPARKRATSGAKRSSSR